MLGGRDTLRRQFEPDAFFWATGIEDTFIVDPWPKTGRAMDEYELTRHYENAATDLKLMSELGVQAARYGIPWYRANPGKGKYDWSFADRALEQMLEYSIEPIVDLVHYGTPVWMDHGFFDPDYPKFVAEYAHAFALRYKGRVRWYTPLNEPRITAWYCGRIGWWPPYGRSWRGFTRVMLSVAEGIARTCQALREADRDIVLAHVDATDIYTPNDPSLEQEARFRQRLVFLALDLITGRLNGHHELWRWLGNQGVDSSKLDWFAQNPAEIDILGINMYPMFSQKMVLRTPRGIRIRMEYATAEIVEKLCDLYFNRYRVPIFISEIASVGAIEKRRRWMDESIASVRLLRERGVPVVGYTWWPMFSLVAWGYRQYPRELDNFMLRMGLWELDLDEKLARVRTPLVDRYERYCDSGVEFVGRLRQN